MGVALRTVSMTNRTHYVIQPQQTLMRDSCIAPARCIRSGLPLERARGLFHDSDTWPARRSPYYIGVLPALTAVESPTAESSDQDHC